MVATPGDGSCGIGTYTRDLRDGLGGVDPTIVPIPQDDRSVRQFVGLAVRAVRADGDAVHVQHEYGLFRRDGSRYPGVMGFVFFPLLFALAALRSQQVVVTMHSVLNPSPDEAPFPVRLSLLLMHKLVVFGASHVVFLSPDCAATFRSRVYLDEQDHSVLSHGVKTDIPVSEPPAEVRRQYGYGSDDKIVAIPGFLRPPKGHDIFIEVARQLPEYEFLVVGGARPKGDDFKFARQIREDAPENVTITGVLDDEEFWNALTVPDLALLPYRVVTQSGTFNCCASVELPVLASEAEYFERIETTWSVPETVPVDDPSLVADRVQVLLEDSVRRAQLATAMSRYKHANSFEAVGRDHLRIYRDVVDGLSPNTVPDTRTSEPSPSRPARAACSAQRSLSYN